MQILNLTVALSSCPWAKTTCYLPLAYGIKFLVYWLFSLCYDPGIVSLALHLNSCLSMVLVHCPSQPLGNLRLQLSYIGYYGSIQDTPQSGISYVCFSRNPPTHIWRVIENIWYLYMYCSFKENSAILTLKSFNLNFIYFISQYHEGYWIMRRKVE